MLERNIDIRDHFPKTIRQLGRARFDLAVNMSGQELPAGAAESILEWDIPDPIRFSYERHCEIRDEIERNVMALILELRREQRAPAFESPAAAKGAVNHHDRRTQRGHLFSKTLHPGEKARSRNSAMTLA